MRKVFAVSALLALACSAGGGARRDGGMHGPGMDGGGQGQVDSGLWWMHDSGPLPDGGPPGPDGGCAATTPLGATIVGDPPDMLLVVDISGSMCAPLIDSFPPSTVTKLAIMKSALHTLVTNMEGRINFGLMLFPSDDSCGAGTVRNMIAPRNASPINATLATLNDSFFACGLSNAGATPTPTSLDSARAYYGTIPVNPIGRYVLLATDGLPNCGAVQPDGSTAETIEETVAAITALHDAGLSTYVLGFGSDLTGDDATLRRFATAGGTGMPYNARSEADLASALDTIAAAVIPPSCTVAIDGPPRDPALFQVRFDGGALIPRNPSHASGWDYDASTQTITFYGPECTAVESGSIANVQVDFGCPGPLI